MRALFELVRCFRFFAVPARRMFALRRQLLMTAMSFCLATLLSVGALGEDPEEPPQEMGDHPMPQIENFEAHFDGIDQYLVLGDFTNCDDQNRVLVSFDGAFEGYSTLTAADGSFGLSIFCGDKTGQLAIAWATCRYGYEAQAQIDLLF
jgi:hypothetical protein